MQKIESEKILPLEINFSTQVQLELTEDSENGTLNFRLLKGDFRRFEGSWSMKSLQEGQGSCLLYELVVQGCIGMPVALIEKRLKEDLTANLLAVEKEAIRQINFA